MCTKSSFFIVYEIIKFEPVDIYGPVEPRPEPSGTRRVHE